MWFFFALVYAFLIAIVIVFDRYIIKNVFTHPMQGLFITIPTSAFVLLGLAPLIEWPESRVFWWAFLAGCFLQASQICYFHAMARADQAGDLSALEASYPILIAIASIFLGKYLNLWEWTGIFIVVGSVMAISWQKMQRADLLYFVFLGLDIIFLALHGLTADYILDGIPFLSFYGPYNLAIIVCGIFAFIIKRNQITEFINNWKEIRKVLPHLSFIEILNILGVTSAAYALSIGHAAMVTAVITTYPVIVFLISALLVQRGVFGFSREKHLYKKITFTLFLVAGLSMISGVSF